MPNYKCLSPELEAQIKADRAAGKVNPYAFRDENVIRRHPDRDRGTLLRPPFIRDIDKILHCPYYNRYADKTQVFSFYKNDDISRRSLHVQLVSRIARSLGHALSLNTDLIEAIALGHDIGHTPFGHAGEEYLDEVLRETEGIRFSHNIQSVRVLQQVFPFNISLQTLSGIASHDGELELREYRPKEISGFNEFDQQIEACLTDKAKVKKLIPSTLEGCVMRIADIIAYLGKDRQDAERALHIPHEDFRDGVLGKINAEIINNLMVNIVENSYGKPYIKMDEDHFCALQDAKRDNYAIIYKVPEVREVCDNVIRPMMKQLYFRLLEDLKKNRTDAPIFRHHIKYINEAHYKRDLPYEQNPPHQIVSDYIASMTDDYFIDLYNHLFPDSKYKIEYKGYFDNN
ncbi:MAG: HD domain-containing protein [Clostridia bacterium]|nr:HD domain-containing protein [Clostridia bacterium]